MTADNRAWKWSVGVHHVIVSDDRPRVSDFPLTPLCTTDVENECRGCLRIAAVDYHRPPCPRCVDYVPAPTLELVPGSAGDELARIIDAADRAALTSIERSY